MFCILAVFFLSQICINIWTYIQTEQGRRDAFRLNKSFIRKFYHCIKPPLTHILSQVGMYLNFDSLLHINYVHTAGKVAHVQLFTHMRHTSDFFFFFFWLSEQHKPIFFPSLTQANVVLQSQPDQSCHISSDVYIIKMQDVTILCYRSWDLARSILTSVNTVCCMWHHVVFFRAVDCSHWSLMMVAFELGWKSDLSWDLQCERSHIGLNGNSRSHDSQWKPIDIFFATKCSISLWFAKAQVMVVRYRKRSLLPWFSSNPGKEQQVRSLGCQLAVKVENKFKPTPGVQEGWWKYHCRGETMGGWGVSVCICVCVCVQR